jgi:hypothetical protein
MDSRQPKRAADNSGRLPAKERREATTAAWKAAPIPRLETPGDFLFVLKQGPGRPLLRGVHRPRQIASHKLAVINYTFWFTKARGESYLPRWKQGGLWWVSGRGTRGNARQDSQEEGLPGAQTQEMSCTSTRRRARSAGMRRRATGLAPPRRSRLPRGGKRQDLWVAAVNRAAPPVLRGAPLRRLGRRTLMTVITGCTHRRRPARLDYAAAWRVTRRLAGKQLAGFLQKPSTPVSLSLRYRARWAADQVCSYDGQRQCSACCHNSGTAPRRGVFRCGLGDRAWAAVVFLLATTGSG